MTVNFNMSETKTNLMRGFCRRKSGKKSVYFRGFSGEDGRAFCDRSGVCFYCGTGKGARRDFYNHLKELGGDTGAYRRRISCGYYRFYGAAF